VRTADLVTAAVLLLLGGVVLADAVRLGVGWGTDGPQSGFFPFWMALLLVLACVAILVQTVRRRPGPRFVTREQIRSVLTVLLPAAGMVLLTEVLGLYVAAGLYLGVYMRCVGRHSWLAVIALALAVPVVTFIIFEQWFLVPMPKGPLEHYWGY
jgi:putative tricarboxylic transport membrane protein